MHDRLLNALQSVADVKLVSRLRDPRLGFSNSKDIRVFIPDLHLISSARLESGNFKFHTNNEDLLIKVIGALRTMSGEVASDEYMGVVHLGDILDLWRETAGVDPSRDTPALIANDHAELMKALRDPGLNATIFLGNHDYDLYQWQSYSGCIRKLFIPEGAPEVLVLHGDVFDWIEKFPEQVKNFLVYVFSPDVAPTDYALGQMYGYVRQTEPDPNNQTFIHCATPAKLGSIRPSADLSVPDYFNVQVKGSGTPIHEFLDLAYEQIQVANVEYGLRLKTVVIGHTHHARIAVREDNGELFTLIDCGAWIENCSVDGTETNAMPNAQIAALSDNEARIYQLVQR